MQARPWAFSAYPSASGLPPSLPLCLAYGSCLLYRNAMPSFFATGPAFLNGTSLPYAFQRRSHGPQVSLTHGFSVPSTNLARILGTQEARVHLSSAGSDLNTARV
eukprot:5197633-Pleurochrysis_carterae.AAC.2